MKKAVKREPGDRSMRGGGGDAERPKRMRREKPSGNAVQSAEDESSAASQQGAADRRVLRSKYLAVINKISEARDDLSSADSKKFTDIISEVDNLHQLVQKPREQVADAEALLDIANSLVTSVKSHSSEGFTPTEFVTSLLKEYRQSNRRLAAQENAYISINWKDVGLAVSPIFRMCRGCCTMLGPMETELKQRKTVVHRKRARPTDSARPAEVEETGEEEKTDTDKNMAVMFEILRRKKSVRLESVILNRRSFAQTVENLFALSFLVKDGRAEIAVNESGSHLVSPRNAPAAPSVMSGEVAYRHFVFRFDFKDWKLMKGVVPVNEELMPHRETSGALAASQAEPAAYTSQGALPTTPIRKFSRNRGLVVQEDSVVEETPDIDDAASKGAGIRKCRRRLN